MTKIDGGLSAAPRPPITNDPKQQSACMVNAACSLFPAAVGLVQKPKGPVHSEHPPPPHSNLPQKEWSWHLQQACW